MFVDHVIYICGLLMLFSFISGIIEYNLARNHTNLLFVLDWPRLWFIFAITIGFIFSLIKLGGWLATRN